DVCSSDLRQTVETGHRIYDGDAIDVEIVLFAEFDVIAADLELCGETVLHSEDITVQGKVGVVPEHMLVMRDEEVEPVDLVRRGIERVLFVVEPVSLRAIIVNLVLDGEVVGDGPFEPA